MYISSLKLKNFKRFEKEEFAFGDINVLEGKNGTGKTAIKDAVIFCLFNRASDGLLARADKLIKSGEKKATVEIIFSNGESLRRDRSGNSTGLYYLDSSQSKEDSEINQSQIEDIIGEDYDTFQCVFNVGYFMSLSDKEKRELMLKWTKPIDRQKLFDKFQIKKEWIDKYNLKTTRIDSQYKELMREKRETEHAVEIRSLEIQNIEGVEIPNPEHKDQSEALKTAEDKIDKAVLINKEWIDYGEKLTSVSEIKSRNTEVEKRIRELKIEEITKPSNSRIVELYKEREKILISGEAEEINSLNLKINELENTISIPEGKCPTCLQAIDPAHKSQVDKHNQEILEKKRGLADWLAKLKLKLEKKTETIKNQLVKEENNYEVQWEQYKRNEENKTELRVLKARLQEIKEPEKPKHPEADIQKLQADREKIKQAHSKYIAEKIQIETLEKRKNAELERKAKLIASKKALEKELDELKYLCSIFSPKGMPAEEMRMKLEPIVETLNEFAPKSRIELLELLKSGMEYREVFQVFVRGKEYNRMSTGEKKKVDIVISKLINKLSGSKLNIFFADNVESIDEIPELTSQTFLARVTQDKELKLTNQSAKKKSESPF